MSSELERRLARSLGDGEAARAEARLVVAGSTFTPAQNERNMVALQSAGHIAGMDRLSTCSKPESLRKRVQWMEMGSQVQQAADPSSLFNVYACNERDILTRAEKAAGKGKQSMDDDTLRHVLGLRDASDKRREAEERERGLTYTAQLAAIESGEARATSTRSLLAPPPRRPVEQEEEETVVAAITRVRTTIERETADDEPLPVVTSPISTSYTPVTISPDESPPRLASPVAFNNDMATAISQRIDSIVDRLDALIHRVAVLEKNTFIP